MNGCEFYRRKNQLTQEKVSAILGIDQSTVCKWEQGASLPRAKLLPKLASLYNCTTDQLLRSRISAAEVDELRRRKKA